MNLIALREVYQNDGSYFEEKLIAGLLCIVTKKKENVLFGRIEFITFTTVTETNSNITEEVIRDFSNASFLNAQNNYDGRGLGHNSGVISISILIGNNVDHSAIEFCKRSSERHWGARQIHIIYHQSIDRFYYYSGWHLWGGLLLSYYRRLSMNMMQQIRAVISTQNK